MKTIDAVVAPNELVPLEPACKWTRSLSASMPSWWNASGRRARDRRR